MEFIKDYASLIFSSLLSLGSVGLIPNIQDIVPQIVIFVVIVMVAMYRLQVWAKKKGKDHYFMSVLSAISILFALLYLFKGNVFSTIAGLSYILLAILYMREMIVNIANETRTYQ